MWGDWKHWHSGIARRLLWWSLGITLVPLVIVMYLMAATSDRVLHDQAMESVRALAAVKADQLETYAAERRADAHAISLIKRIGISLERLTQSFAQSGVASPARTAIEQETRELLRDVTQPYGYVDAFLVSPAGDEVVSMERLGEQGTNYLTGPYRETELARVFNLARTQKDSVLSNFAPFERSNSPAVFVAAPVFKDDVLLGVLILQIGLKQIYETINDYTGLGETGEIVIASLVGGQVTFMAPTRHDPQAAFQRTMPASAPAAHRLHKAVHGEDGFGNGVDYRGVPTIAAWHYLPSWNWGMVVKIDEAEVFAPLVREQRRGLVMALFTLAIVAVMAFRGAVSVSGPIVQLTQVARHMAGGDLSQQVAVVRSDEIGELAQTFNTMSADLRAMYTTIEAQVRWRTRQQEAVAELGAKALSGGDWESLLNEAVSLVARTLQVELAQVLELQPDGRELLLRAGTGWKDGLVGHACLSANIETASGYILSTNQPVIIEDLRTESRFRVSPLLLDHGAVCGLGCVIPGPIRPYGVLGGCATQPRSFSKNDIHFLQAVAHVLSAAIERQRSEDALRRSESNLNRAQAVAHIGSWYLDIPRNELRWSDESYRVFHVPLGSSLTYESFLAIVHPEDRDFVHQAWTAAMHGAPYDIEHRILADGEIRWVRETAEVQFDAAGQALSGIGITHDITDRKQSEEALRHASHYNRSLIEASLDPLVTIGKDGKIMDVNATTETVTGCTRQELIGQDFADYFTDPNRARAGYQEVFREGVVRDYALEIRHKDGHLTPVFYNASIFRDEAGQVMGVFAAARDITERHRAEEAIRLNLAAMEAAANGIAIADVNGVLQWVNPAFTKLTGYAASEAIGLNPRVLKSGKQSLEFYEQLWQTITSGDVWHGELVNKRKDGSLYDEEMTITPVRDVKGTISHFVAIKQDITVRKRAEEELQQANRALRTLSECNAALVRTADERELLDRICQIVVDIGGYRLAWVGYAEHDEAKSVRPVSHAGHEDGYLETLKISWADTERGRGPTGTALRSGQPYLNRDLANNPAFAPWKDEALKRGYASSLVLPLIAQNQILGTLSIYSDMPDGFSETQISLLTELSNDLAFGIASLRTQAARKLAEETLRDSEETLRAISDSALDGVILLDAEDKVRHWNPAAEKIFGYTNAEFLGQTLHGRLAPSEQRELYARGLEHFHQTGEGPVLGKTLETEAVRKDGSRFPVELSIVGVFLKGAWNAVGIVRDITARKRAENELKQAKDAAEVANQAKSEFLANMSHEIRTPMNGIIGLTGLVLDTELNPEQREYLNGVATSAESLLKIINTILDFSKVEAGQMELERIDFDLRETLGETIQTLALRARQKGLELRCEVRPDVPDALVGDPDRLRQIVINLVENAVKFTQQGTVSVLIETETLTEDWVSLHGSVSDTGIGIPPDKQQILFRRFVQADSSMTRKYGGTGLGLAISAQLVELMQGRMWLESEVGRGSTFHFTVRFALRTAPVQNLPIVPPTRQPTPAPARTMTPTDRRLRILVAEDNQVNQLLAVRTLEKAGHSVGMANNGAEALAAIERQPFDLILMDVQMPVMDGFQATARIREREQKTGQHLPIVAMTAHALKGDRERCLEAGMDDYVAKPLHNQELFSAIARNVNGRRQPAMTNGEEKSITMFAKKNGHPLNTSKQEPMMSSNAIPVVSTDDASDDPLAGDLELRKELAAMFLEDCPKLLSEIRTAMTQHDGPGLKLAAHTLKGSAGVFKVQSAFDAALRMEHVGRDCDWEHSEEAWNYVTKEMASLSATLSSLTKSATATNSW